MLGHRVSRQEVEVDNANIKVIEKLPPPTTMNRVRSFLEHVGLYHRFIKDFSKISKPLYSLLEVDKPFNFSPVGIQHIKICSHLCSNYRTAKLDQIV